MDTQYTQGFKAGLAWREAEVMKLLLEEYTKLTNSGHWAESNYYVKVIALIKGEK